MYIVFDIGGTKLRLASSIDGKAIEKSESISTPQTYEAGLVSLLKLAKELSAGRPVTKMVGGVPGQLNEKKTMLAKASHLQDWVNKPLAKDLSENLNTVVELENDAALGALGEANFGAGKNYQRVIYIAIGTGYGGAWVINGQLAAGKFGFEPGHQIVNIADNTELETLVSGSSLASKYGQQLETIPADKLWADMEVPLCIGIYNSFLHWPSDIVVLGGGVVLNSGLSLEKLKNRLSDLLRYYPSMPLLALSKLGDQAGLHGALTLLT